MAGKTITFSLSSSSIGQAISELNKYIDEVRSMLGELVRQLTEQGAQIAMVKVAELGAVDTGELSDSIWGYYDEDSHVGIIRANAPYAFFVEYGTGIMGTDHPDSGGEWAPPPVTVVMNGKTYGPYVGHDTNGHGENGWFYISSRDGRRHWTRGQTTAPFMYQTFKELQELAPSIAAKIFNA